MEKNTIKVFARLKPSSKQTNDKIYEIVKKPEYQELTFCRSEEHIDILTNKNKPQVKYRFHHIFEENSAQREVFEQLAKPVINSVFEGYNGTIFAYGQTGCGKTYSMRGNPDDSERKGIIPRTLHYIFNYIKKTNKIYTVLISYMEIYNEIAYDLLKVSNTLTLEELPRVVLLDDGDGHTNIRNLRIESIITEKEAMKFLKLGESNRKVAETPLNPRSSRSHCVFTIYVSGFTDNGTVQRSKLHLVDLAGSERVYKSCLTGLNLTEALNINLSLHFLEQVILALSEPKRTHIPYRNSIMTTVLRDSLGGNCMAVMLAAVSTDLKHIHESISTCKFSQRVAMVKTELSLINEIDPQEEINSLKLEIENLKKQLSTHNKNRSQVETKVYKDELTEEEVKDCKSQLESFLKGLSCDVSETDDPRRTKIYFQMLREKILSLKKLRTDLLDPDKPKLETLDPNKELYKKYVLPDLNEKEKEAFQTIMNDPKNLMEINTHISDLKNKYTTAKIIADRVEKCKQNVVNLKKRIENCTTLNVQERIGFETKLKIHENIYDENVMELQKIKKETDQIKQNIDRAKNSLINKTRDLIKNSQNDLEDQVYNKQEYVQNNLKPYDYPVKLYRKEPVFNNLEKGCQKLGDPKQKRVNQDLLMYQDGLIPQRPYSSYNNFNQNETYRLSNGIHGDYYGIRRFDNQKGCQDDRLYEKFSQGSDGGHGDPKILGNHQKFPDVSSKYVQRIEHGKYNPKMEEGSHNTNREHGNCNPNMENGRFSPKMRNGGYNPDMRIGSCNSSMEVGCCNKAMEHGGYNPRMEHGSYNPRMEHGSSNPRMEHGSSNPNMENGNCNPNMENGSYNPKTNHGSYHPNMENGSYNPSMENGRYHPKMNNGSYNSSMENGCYNPKMQNGSYNPKMDHVNYKPSIENGCYNPNMENGSSHPKIGHVNYYPSVENGCYNPNLENGSSHPKIGHGKYYPSVENRCYNPNMENGSSHPKKDHGNYNPSLENGSNNPNLENGSSHPKMDHGNYNPKMENGNSNPKMENGSSHPKINHGNYNQTLESGSYNPNIEYGSCDPKRDHRNYNPSIENGSHNPNMENRSSYPKMNHGNYNPCIENGSYNPNIENGGYNPKMDHGNYNPSVDNGSYHPNMENGCYDPKMDHKNYNRSIEVGGYNPKLKNGSSNPKIENVSYNPKQENKNYYPTPQYTTSPSPINFQRDYYGLQKYQERFSRNTPNTTGSVNISRMNPKQNLVDVPTNREYERNVNQDDYYGNQKQEKSRKEIQEKSCNTQIINQNPNQIKNDVTVRNNRGYEKNRGDCYGDHQEKLCSTPNIPQINHPNVSTNEIISIGGSYLRPSDYPQNVNDTNPGLIHTKHKTNNTQSPLAIESNRSTNTSNVFQKPFESNPQNSLPSNDNHPELRYGDIPLTGDPDVDAEIIAFYKSRD